MGYKRTKHYLEKILKSNKPFEKTCLRCGKIFNIRDYHPIHFSKRKFCSSNCERGYVCYSGASVFFIDYIEKHEACHAIVAREKDHFCK